MQTGEYGNGGAGAPRKPLRRADLERHDRNESARGGADSVIDGPGGEAAGGGAAFFDDCVRRLIATGQGYREVLNALATRFHEDKLWTRPSYRLMVDYVRQHVPLRRPRRGPHGARTSWRPGNAGQEELPDRADGPGSLPAPAYALRTTLEAIASARAMAAAHGESIHDGEALARIADHYARVTRMRRARR